jgi:hypothetical protein
MTKRYIPWIARMLGMTAGFCVLVLQVFAADSSVLKHHESMTFGIDYAHPEIYVRSGTQTTLTDEQFADIKQMLQFEQIDLAAIRKLYRWKRQYFGGERGGGKYVGRHTITDILTKRVLTGCHDHGLVVAAILRRYGIPVVYVDTTGIEWGLKYPEKTRLFEGHVFIEVFLEGKWMLFDSGTGAYISDYDPTNPLIPVRKSHEPKGYYVMFKGLDPADYGITELRHLTETQKRYADLIKAEIQNFHYPEYTIKQ